MVIAIYTDLSSCPPPRSKPVSAPRPHPADDTRPGSSGRVCSEAMKLVLDLHEIFNKGRDIERALNEIMAEAVAKKAPMIEIIPGKGSGALKKTVLRFLERKDI